MLLWRFCSIAVVSVCPNFSTEKKKHKNEAGLGKTGNVSDANSGVCGGGQHMLFFKGEV